jgi:L-fucose isomerase
MFIPDVQLGASHGLSATDISGRSDHIVIHAAYSVCMHNVEDKNVFRPAWGAFGMDQEGSDYQACQVWGAL